MTDLEELFRPLIEDGAQQRVPVETIETRARELESRHHRRQRAQYRFGASFVAVAIVAATVGIVHARDGGAGRAGPAVTTAAPATDITPVVPQGWVSYDYGLARLSVPPDYTAVSGNGCGAPDGPLLELQTTADNSDPVCGHPPAVVLSPTSGPKPLGLSGNVNGIDYIAVPAHCPPDATPPSTSSPSTPVCEPSFWVPALGIDIFFEFTHADHVADIDAILHTLTYSTYARFLQQPFGTASPQWKSVAFGGYTVRVPAAWHVVGLDKPFGFCSPDRNTVYLGVNNSPSCFATQFAPVPPPEDSLQLSIVPTDHSGTPSTMPDSTILRHNGLQFAVSPEYGPIGAVLGIVIEGGARPVQVLLGLGLDPAVARGILGSLTAP